MKVPTLPGPLGSLVDRLGFGHGGERYTYEHDERFGPMSASRRPDEWVRTTCGYCSVGCGMLIGVRDGKAVAVQGDPDHPVNRGRLCPKGLTEHHTIGAPGRLTTPVVNGQAASWDDALGHMAGTFRHLIDEHGPESVAILSTGQLVTEEFYALGKLARLGLGIAHYDGNTTLCMASAASGYKLAFGSDGPPGCYDDFVDADLVVLFGANVADNHPLIAPRLMGPNRPRLIVVDPRVTKTAMIADQHLPLKPRTDITLINGLLHILFAEDLVDRAYLAEHTVGLAELEAHVAAYDPERVAAECGISVESLVEAARAIGAAERCTFAWTMGINHSVQGTESVALICSLAAATGHIGKPGSSPFSITGQCNAMGTRETGFTASMPGYRAYDDPAARAELAELWGVSADDLPTERGRAYPDIINAVMNGRIKALWIIGTNPLVSFPNREVLEHSLRRLELLVVQDGFETPTTALADVVLPAAIWGEKEGTFTNSERRVSRVRAAVRAARGGPTRLRRVPRPGRAPRAARPHLPGLDGAEGRVRGVAPGVRRSAVRLQRHHLRADRRGRRRAVAVPRRRPRPCRSAGHPACTPTAASPTPRARSGCTASTARSSATSRGRSSRSCSTPVARSSTGTPAPRPRASRSSSGWPPRPGWRSTTPTPTGSGSAPATSCGCPRRGASSSASSPGSPRSSGPARCSSRSTTTRPA